MSHQVIDSIVDVIILHLSDPKQTIASLRLAIQSILDYYYIHSDHYTKENIIKCILLLSKKFHLFSQLDQDLKIQLSSYWTLPQLQNMSKLNRQTRSLYMKLLLKYENDCFRNLSNCKHQPKFIEKLFNDGMPFTYILRLIQKYIKFKNYKKPRNVFRIFCYTLLRRGKRPPKEIDAEQWLEIIFKEYRDRRKTFKELLTFLRSEFLQDDESRFIVNFIHLVYSREHEQFDILLRLIHEENIHYQIRSAIVFVLLSQAYKSGLKTFDELLIYLTNIPDDHHRSSLIFFLIQAERSKLNSPPTFEQLLKYLNKDMIPSDQIRAELWIDILSDQYKNHMKSFEDLVNYMTKENIPDERRRSILFARILHWDIIHKHKDLRFEKYITIDTVPDDTIRSKLWADIILHKYYDSRRNLNNFKKLTHYITPENIPDDIIRSKLWADIIDRELYTEYIPLKKREFLQLSVTKQNIPCDDIRDQILKILKQYFSK